MTPNSTFQSASAFAGEDAEHRDENPDRRVRRRVRTEHRRARRLPTKTQPIPGRQAPSEASFVKAIQADLSAALRDGRPTPRRPGTFATPAEDDTGAISYANHAVAVDRRHNIPSQLWYNVNGNLLGADFSIPNKGNARPVIWGINPGRWYEFDAHMHWVSKDPATGKLTYDSVDTGREVRGRGRRSVASRCRHARQDGQGQGCGQRRDNLRVPLSCGI